ncbi:MAG: beta-ketoacyl-[acyl-carrier-protein] synthase family protein [Planctomycetales bacterium]|nr:beta-ketoacyl-[acyl-carrier-protein] synthase family protein [Planctomycetales bacterium]
MAQPREIVITGIGVVSPLGIGIDAFRQSLAAQRSGVGPLTIVDTTHLPMPYGGELRDFDPKLYVKPRKSLKVMSRDIQTAYAAADLAMQHGKLEKGQLPPERLGVVFGADMIYGEMPELELAFRGCLVDGQFDHGRWGESAMANIFPLWMLKYLPNYPACHVGIVHDARGPNNTITLGEASSLLAIGEAASCIQRGMADVMLTGGTGSRLSLATLAFFGHDVRSHRKDAPQSASRPFDAQRDGMVYGEGSAVMLIEAREHAEARGAKILGRLLGWASAYENRRFAADGDGSGYDRAIGAALRAADVAAADVGHVNAHGESTIAGDRNEAGAIRRVLADVPVLAMKSYFGNLGAGGGAVELLASLLAFESGEVPVSLNYETPDPACPVNVVHGSPLSGAAPLAVAVNQSRTGQTSAVVVAGA